MLKNHKTGRHPVFIGPMLVHQKQTYETYYYFASQLLKLNRRLSSLNAVGTDREEQLGKAFGTVFPGAVKLLCCLHKRDNIKMKLRALGVSEQLSREILDSIFGYQIDETYFTGLMDGEEEVEDFQKKLLGLKPQWDKAYPNFHQWFLQNEADLFCSGIIRLVRSVQGWVSH